MFTDNYISIFIYQTNFGQQPNGKHFSVHGFQTNKKQYFLLTDVQTLVKCSENVEHATRAKFL